MDMRRRRVGLIVGLIGLPLMEDGDLDQSWECVADRRYSLWHANNYKNTEQENT